MIIRSTPKPRAVNDATNAAYSGAGGSVDIGVVNPLAASQKQSRSILESISPRLESKSAPFAEVYNLSSQIS